MCRQVDIERDEIVTLSREEFRELSRGILGYNAIQHAKVFCAWKQAKQQEHQVAAVKSSKSDEEEEEIPTPVAARSGSWISPEKVGSTSQNIEKGRAKNLATINRDDGNKKPKAKNESGNEDKKRKAEKVVTKKDATTAGIVKQMKMTDRKSEITPVKKEDETDENATSTLAKARKMTPTSLQEKTRGAKNSPCRCKGRG